MSRVYLRSDVQAEPLVDQWYAWPHLIPPATAARNMMHRHIPIMDSYISTPQIHAKAVKNPKMLGGPFIDYDGQYIQEIRELRDQTLTKRRRLTTLSKALEEIDRLLETQANGESLERLYPLIPAILKGHIELVYDLNNHPRYRIIEPLVYRTFYETDGQAMMLSISRGDDRPFVLSTPRLALPGLLHMSLPFDHASLDYLFSSKATPRDCDELLERCEVARIDQAMFRSFLTAEPPRPYCGYQGKGIRWRYFGHACILLETRSVSFLFDPVLSYTYESNISRYTYADLPDKIDYVLITHNHQDHLLFETMLQIRHKIGCVVVPKSGGGYLQDPSLKLVLQSVGFKNVVELGEMESIECECGKVMGLPFLGEHADLDIRSKSAYVLEVANNRFLFAADSCNIEPALYEHIQREVGDIRALFVGMECAGAPLSWLYGPLLTRRIDRSQDESRRLSGSNCEQAMNMARTFNCREVFVYAMGQEPWLKYIMSIKYSPESGPMVQSTKFIEECRQRGILAERLYGEREMLLD